MHRVTYIHIHFSMNVLTHIFVGPLTTMCRELLVLSVQYYTSHVPILTFVKRLLVMKEIYLVAKVPIAAAKCH